MDGAFLGDCKGEVGILSDWTAFTGFWIDEMTDEEDIEVGDDKSDDITASVRLVR